MLRLIWCIRRGWRVKLVMTSPNCANNISHKMKPHSNMMTRHSSDMKICFALSNSGLFFEMRAYFPLQRSGMFKFNQKFVACTCQSYQKKSQNIQMQIWHISMGNNTTRENRKTTTKIKLQTKQTSSIFSFHLLNCSKEQYVLFNARVLPIPMTVAQHLLFVGCMFLMLCVSFLLFLPSTGAVMWSGNPSSMTLNTMYPLIALYDAVPFQKWFCLPTKYPNSSPELTL